MVRYSIVGAEAEDIKDAGASNVKVMRNSGVVYADLSDAQADALREKGFQVVTLQKITPPVSTPVPVSGAPVYTPTELLDALGIEEFRSMTDPPLTGIDIYIAILGTGIRATHRDLGGKVVHSRNYTTSPAGDAFDHDTGVASIVHTVVPEAGLLDFKVIDDSGAGTDESVVGAIEDCIDMNVEQLDYAPDIINMSLGAPDDGNPYSPMRVACRAAIEAGIWIFVAAGNSGPNPMTITSPACEKYAMAVGSCKLNPFDISEFSSRGPTVEGLVKPDAVMLGEDIIMASGKGDTATEAKSGTSFSTPFASGAAALYLNGERVWGDLSKATGMPEFMVRQVPYPMTQEGLVDVFLPATGVKPSGVSPGKDNSFGYGLPYALQLFEQMQVAGAVEPLISMIIVMMMMKMMMGVVKEVK